MSLINVLEKTEPTYFPFQVVKSDDGGGNLVAYDSGNPTTGWTAPMATPFNGLWVRVEFSDYHVNFKHNGTTWVEYNKEAKSGGSITLYSTAEVDTGMVDSNGDAIYSQYFNIASNDARFSTAIGNPISGTKGYILLDYGNDYFKNMYPMKITRVRDYGFGPIKYYQYFGYDVFMYNNTFGSDVMWAIGFNTAAFSAIESGDTSTYLIEIYYTKN